MLLRNTTCVFFTSLHQLVQCFPMFLRTSFLLLSKPTNWHVLWMFHIIFSISNSTELPRNCTLTKIVNTFYSAIFCQQRSLNLTHCSFKHTQRLQSQCCVVRFFVDMCFPLPLTCSHLIPNPNRLSSEMLDTNLNQIPTNYLRFTSPKCNPSANP